MLFEKFKNNFHESWHTKIRKFIESKECDEIYAHLKKESSRGIQIAPSSSVTFRAFKETPLNECRAIIIGLCPYHTFVNNVSICDGLALSCSITGKMQPSLKTLLDAIERDVYNGLALDRIKNPDLTYLARDEKVLLINAALTTSRDKAGNMVELWEPFMKYLLEEVVGYTGIPIIFLGIEAAKLKKYVTPFTHMFFLKHPSYYARVSEEMETNGVFSKVSQIVKENNGYIINWLQKIDDSSINNDEIPF